MNIVYWWQSGTLFNACMTEDDGCNPSEVFTSTDLSDALSQLDYDSLRVTFHPNEAPDFELERW